MVARTSVRSRTCHICGLGVGLGVGTVRECRLLLGTEGVKRGIVIAQVELVAEVSRRLRLGGGHAFPVAVTAPRPFAEVGDDVVGEGVPMLGPLLGHGAAVSGQREVSSGRRRGGAELAGRWSLGTLRRRQCNCPCCCLGCGV